LRQGSAPLNFFYNHADTSLHLINNGFVHQYDLMLVMSLFDKEGKERSLGQVFAEIGPSTTRKVMDIQRAIRAASREEGCFLSLKILNLEKQVLSQNLYWLPDSTGQYSGLNRMKEVKPEIRVKETAKGKIAVTISVPAGGPISFFNRLSLVDPSTKKRLLPVFYEDNYISVLPGESRTVELDYSPKQGLNPLLSVEGWNLPVQYLNIN
jgi:hypothetical protein